MSKDRRLGRGLAALLGTTESDNHESPPLNSGEVDSVFSEGQESQDYQHQHNDGQQEHSQHHEHHHHDGHHDGGNGDSQDAGEMLLSVYEIDDNPFQPRREFSEPEIVSLAESLKEHDMLQPVLVRRNGDRFQLISGERRLRAAIKAGWASVPARLREADDRLVAELAIVENLQRQDLNAIEKALSFKRYIDEHQCTQEDLAGRLKIDRSTIANLVRLLELPQAVQDSLGSGAISAGHARALLPLGDEHLQIEFCRQIQEEGHSVRETERRVGERIQQEDGEPLSVVGGGNKRPKNEQVASLEQELRVALGTKVDIRQTSRGRGRIVIHFNSHEEFDRIRELLSDSHDLDRHSNAG